MDCRSSPGIDMNLTNLICIACMVGLNDIDGPTIYEVAFLPTIPYDTEEVTVNCTVVDDYSNVDKVTIYYRESGQQWSTKDFTLLIGETYQVEIGPFIGNQTIEFYINASDDSANANFAINDNSGSFYSFTVKLTPTEESPVPYIIPIIAVSAIIILYRRRK